MSELGKKILTKRDRAHEVVEVPEWDCKVEIRSMSARLRSEYLAMHAANQGGNQENMGPADVKKVYGELFPMMLIGSLYDPETGERLFSDRDADAIMEMSGDVVERLALRCIEVSKIGGKAVDDAGNGSSTPSKTEAEQESVTPSDSSTSS